MRNRILAFIGAFILSINLIGQSSLTAYANGGGVCRTDLQNWENWTFTEKWDYHNSHLVDWCGSIVGCFLRGDSEALYRTYLRQCWDDLAVESMSYEEWIASKFDYNTETQEFSFDDELVDLMKKACDKYISEECGWYEFTTLDFRDYPSNQFCTLGLYESFKSHCERELKGTDNIIIAVCPYWMISSQYTADTAFTISETLENVEFYIKDINESTAYLTVDWETYSYDEYYLTTVGTLELRRSGFSNSCFIFPYVSTSYSYAYYPLTDGSRTIRVYKTLEDLKSYSVGQRPYYVTDKFQDYDINGDNSCILSESDLSNGSVYGDVYNYIINNYDNPDGLTEDELRDILDDYFNNSGGGSGSSGNDSGSGSSGNGLLDFLGGLGSIGDAILSILGKLMEYIGKALDLIGGTVTKVIDIIPKNITALLGALFPFFPEEWLTAIELGLVLAVIVGIVGLFKK